MGSALDLPDPVANHNLTTKTARLRPHSTQQFAFIHLEKLEMSYDLIPSQRSSESDV
jgi:hypothetical protein